MKKFSPVSLFFGGSLLILLIFTLLFWSYYQNNPESIDHVRLKDWSQPVELAVNVPSVSYDALFSEDGFDLFTIQEDRDSREKFLTQSKLNYHGEVKEKLEIGRAGQLSFPEVVVYEDKEYLFYFSGESSRNQDLIAFNINDSEQKVLRKNISFSNALAHANSEDMIILTYTEKATDSGDDTISIIGFDPENQDDILNYSYSFDLQVRYPKLAKIGDKIFIIWHERDPDTMFISGQEGTINRYFLKAAELDLQTGELANEKVLANAYGKSSANIDISQTEDQLWISWVEYNRDSGIEFINLGSLNSNGEFKHFSQKAGFNPSIHFNDDDNKLVNLSSRELQTSLFLNQFTETDTELNGQRMFPDLNTSRAPKLVNYQGNDHLLWTESASTGRDIYYSNTVEAEDIKLFELMGFSAISSPMELFSSLILFFGYPIMAFNFAFINYYIPMIIVFLAFYLLGKKSSSFYEFKHSSPYVSFISMIMTIFVFIWLAQGEIQYLFTITSPPESQMPLIAGIVTLITLAYIYLSRYDQDHSIFIGFGSVLLWFYWLAQAGLVYEFYQYFI